MDDLKVSIVASLDGESEALFPYLPYLLQDLWEIGSFPRTIVQLMKKHTLHHHQSFTVLDLGCGKGAVAITIAQELECQVYGIDGMPEFIAQAKTYAKTYHVEHLCRFDVGDIRQEVQTLHDYDLVILGSLGPVFGDIEATLRQVKSCVKPGGCILLDDAYIPDESELKSEVYLKRSQVLEQIRRSGVAILDECILERADIVESDVEIFQHIKRRAFELIEQHPEKKALFEGYVHAQQRENEILENYVTCVTWVLTT
jgi:ubiquinone/menaquinone biosynthesis C-methylase UbiE